MKKFFVMMLSAAVFTTAAFAKIPAKITDAFQNRYAGATNVEWQHSISHYKASFDMGSYRYESRFNKKGKWLGSEKMLGKEKLPFVVKNNLMKSKYGNWRIKSSYEAYLPHEKPSYHVMAAKGDFKRKDLVFDHHGQLRNG